MKRIDHFRMAGFCCLIGVVVLQGSDMKEHEAVTPVSRPGAERLRHERFNERVSKGNVDLVFIGDSITEGWEEEGRKVWQKFYGTRNAVNLGIGGDRTQHVIWRLDHGNLKGITPQAAVLMIGTNNSADNSPQEIADGISRIVHQIRDKTPEPRILLLAIFPRGKDPADSRRQVNQKTNGLIQKLNDNKHVFYLDIGQHFLTPKGQLTLDIMPDLLHLSEKAYQIWAEAIESSLIQLLKE